MKKWRRRKKELEFMFVTLLLLIRCLTCFSEDNADDLTSTLVLREGYDARIRPNECCGGLEHVRVSFVIISTDDIKVNAQEFKVDLVLWLMWTDPRLSFNGKSVKYVHASEQSTVWVPDIYIVNAKGSQFHNTTESNRQMMIRPDGFIIYSMRLTVIARCNIDLRMFPFDVQRCPIIIQSYSHPASGITCEWADDGKNGSTYVTALRDRAMAQYDLHEFRLFHEQIPYNHPDKQGNWSTLTAVFAFKRLSGFYVFQTLAPSNLIIILSWISFLIEPKQAPARVFLGISCVLAMSGIQTYVNISLPKVSYIKILDIYLLVGYFFVVMVLVEYAVVLLLVERIRKDDLFRREKKLPVLTKRTQLTKTPLSRCWSHMRLCFHGNPFCMDIPKNAAAICDRVFIVIVPLMYAIFNAVFWVHVNLKSRDLDESTHMSSSVAQEMLMM